MIDKPSLLDTPNLINWKEYTPSDIPGSSVDYCYGNDSSIRQNYDGTDTAEWNTGKQIQETLPAAEWDAFIHDIGAFGWQMTELTRSIWEELYSAIHGQQTGMSHELLDAIGTNAQTLTNKIISFDSNTLQNVASLNTAQTLKNKTISFDDNTLQNVASLNTAQTLTNKIIDGKDNTIQCSPTFVYSDTTIQATKEMNIIIQENYVCVTLAQGYDGIKISVGAKGCVGFILFQDNTCISINDTVINVTLISGKWQVESGATLYLDTAAYDSRPTGTTPNDWKNYISNGTLNYIYNYDSSGRNDYDLPSADCKITVACTGTLRGSAIAVGKDSGSATRVWSRTKGNSYWDNTWTQLEDGSKPAIGVPTLWFGNLPNWALNFGNGAATKYAWANYPKLYASTEFKNTLQILVDNGWMTQFDTDISGGFYVPDLRGIIPVVAGTNAKRTAESTAGGNLGEYIGSRNKYHGHTGSGSFSGTNRTGVFDITVDASGVCRTKNHSGVFSGVSGSNRAIADYTGTSTSNGRVSFSMTPAGSVSVTVGAAGASTDSAKPPTVGCIFIVRYE